MDTTFLLVVLKGMMVFVTILIWAVPFVDKSPEPVVYNVQKLSKLFPLYITLEVYGPERRNLG